MYNFAQSSRCHGILFRMHVYTHPSKVSHHLVLPTTFFILRVHGIGVAIVSPIPRLLFLEHRRRKAYFFTVCCKNQPGDEARLLCECWQVKLCTAVPILMLLYK